MSLHDDYPQNLERADIQINDKSIRNEFILKVGLYFVYLFKKQKIIHYVILKSKLVIWLKNIFISIIKN